MDGAHAPSVILLNHMISSKSYSKNPPYFKVRGIGLMMTMVMTAMAVITVIILRHILIGLENKLNGSKPHQEPDAGRKKWINETADLRVCDENQTYPARDYSKTLKQVRKNMQDYRSPNQILFNRIPCD